ncbi:MAG: OB-fold domain-containing protein, partial [Clostridia bacterium]
MYDYIKGRVTAAGNDFLVVENNGIGYRIYSSVNTLAKLQKNDDNTTLFTYLHVREDIMQL